jgi:plastocyanin
VGKLRNIIIAIIVIVLAVVGFFLFRNFSQEPSVTVVNTPTATSSATPSASEAESSATITYTSSGFLPSEITLQSGDELTWMNDGDKEIQIGADPHPIHTGNKEVSGGGFVLTLQPGEQATVTLEKKGTFGYHDHLNASQGGTITVE